MCSDVAPNVSRGITVSRITSCELSAKITDACSGAYVGVANSEFNFTSGAAMRPANFVVVNYACRPIESYETV